MIDFAALRVFTETGDGDIAITFPLPQSRPEGRHALAYYRVHFTDLGSASTETANLVVSVDSKPHQTTSGPFDATLFTDRDLGIGTDGGEAIDEDEMHRWLVNSGWGHHFAWTNPDPGNIAWGLEAGLLAVDLL